MSESSEASLKLLRGLRSIKAYTDEPVPREAIDGILEVGRWSGSGANKQPTEVIVVRDAAVRQQFAEWGAKPAATAPVVLLILVANNGSALDEGRLAERLGLAASAYGLGSTVATLKQEGPEAVKQLLGIPEHYRSTTVVAVGHVDQAVRAARPRVAQARKPMSEFAHTDRY
jgi:nitroreductase